MFNSPNELGKHIKMHIDIIILSSKHFQEKVFYCYCLVTSLKLEWIEVSESIHIPPRTHWTRKQPKHNCSGVNWIPVTGQSPAAAHIFSPWRDLSQNHPNIRLRVCQRHESTFAGRKSDGIERCAARGTKPRTLWRNGQFLSWKCLVTLPYHSRFKMQVAPAFSLRV